MKNKLPLLMLAISLSSTLAYADHSRGFYAGGAMSHVSSDPLIGGTATRNEISLPALELIGGYKHNQWLGLEIRYGIGTDERDLSTGTDGEQLYYSLDDYQSIYYRAEVSNAESKLYFLLGQSDISGTEKMLVGGDVISETSSSYSGLSYGIGAGWFVDDYLNINIEYRAVLDDDLDEFNATTLSFDYRFKGTGIKFW